MNRDFVEMLSALSAAGADYLIVGAYAMAAHGWRARRLDGIETQVIGFDALLKNKLAAGRAKDLADVAWLQSKRGR